MNQKHRVSCPSCGSSNVCCLGTIPASNVFAGRQLDRVLFGGALWRCSTCHLVFRYPRTPKQELNTLYRLGHDESWPDSVEDRADWVLAAKLISSFPNIKRVLDVGCFDGRLLDYLDSSYEKLGVEIHQAAAERASKRGVNIIAREFDELALYPATADVVLAMDVIEHVEDPLEFLTQLVKVVTPGGIIIIATGNTASPSWRLMGSHYWYCHIAEHISFINPTWTHQAAHHLGLEVLSIKSFSHVGNQGKTGRRLRELIINLAYRVAPWIFRKLRQLGLGGVNVVYHPELLEVPPYWLTAQDHILIAFKKK